MKLSSTILIANQYITEMTGDTHIIDFGAFDLPDTVPQLHDVRGICIFIGGGMISI